MEGVRVCFPLQAALYGGACHALSNSRGTILVTLILGQFSGSQQYLEEGVPFPNWCRGACCLGGEGIL